MAKAKREFEYSVVDAFTARPFAGNPAGVVFAADGLDDEQMRAIAAEFNLSETTFVLSAQQPGAAVRFRWFTPSVEVRMCGHATIGGVHALVERGRFAGLLREPGTLLGIETLSGVLHAQGEFVPGGEGSAIYWLELRRPTLRPIDFNRGKLAEAVGIDESSFDKSLPMVLTQDDDLIVFVETYVALVEARPRFEDLAAWCTKKSIRGVCVATLNTLSSAAQVQSRFFAPTCGVNEDPVTGSVHGPLAAYLVAYDVVPHSGSVSALTCIQAVPGGRAGLVRAMVERQRGEGFIVRIGGECRTIMRGTLFV